MGNLSLHGFGSKYRTGSKLAVSSQSQLTFPFSELVKREKIKENYIDYLRSVMIGFDGEIYLFSSTTLTSNIFDIFIFSPDLELKRTISGVDFSNVNWLIPMLSSNDKVASSSVYRRRINNGDEECFYFYRVAGNKPEIVKYTKDFVLMHHVVHDPSNSSNSFSRIVDLAQGKDYTLISFISNYNTTSTYFTFVFSNVTGDLVHELIQAHASSSIKDMNLLENFNWFIDDNKYRSNTQLNVNSFTEMVEVDIEKFEWSKVETYTTKTPPPLSRLHEQIGFRELLNGDKLIWGINTWSTPYSLSYAYLESDFRMKPENGSAAKEFSVGNDKYRGSIFNEDLSWTTSSTTAGTIYFENTIKFELSGTADCKRMRIANPVINITGKPFTEGNTIFMFNSVNNTLIIFDIDRTYNFLHGYVHDANLYTTIMN